MIHVRDQEFDQKVSDAFEEAYMTHTSTSPNYPILASLDMGRRQVELEGYRARAGERGDRHDPQGADSHGPAPAAVLPGARAADMIEEAHRPSG
jgi:arginine decarboxylase